MRLSGKEVMRCLLSCKDTNFKANHNQRVYTVVYAHGVCYLAKIRILKQITTFTDCFISNKWCLLSCKDTNFKANHNLRRKQPRISRGVCYLAKIRILKQITTCHRSCHCKCKVFVILQRYEF